MKFRHGSNLFRPVTNRNWTRLQKPTSLHSNLIRNLGMQNYFLSGDDGLSDKADADIQYQPERTERQVDGRL